MEDVKVKKEQDVSEGHLEGMLSGDTVIYSAGIMKAVSMPGSKARLPKRDVILSNGCLLQPFRSNTYLNYYGLDSTFQTCVELKKNNIVGQGYSFRAQESPKLKEVQDFLRIPNDNISDTFPEMMKNVYGDLDLFMNGYLEYVKSGSIRKLYYIQAKDIYIKPKRDRGGNITPQIESYMQIDSENNVLGEYKPYPIDGKTKDGVHYIIHFRGRHPSSMHYGEPDKDALFNLIKQSYLADQYNINFFSNGGQPAWAITITGGKLSKKGYEKIQQFIENSLKGVGNSHKMLFLSLPNEKADIKLIPLSKAIDEQFLTLSEKIQYRIAQHCQVHPKLLGLSVGGNFGGGSAGVADLKLFLETVYKPESLRISTIIDNFLFLEFGIDCGFTFNRINISNEKDIAVIANLYWGMVDHCGNRVIDVNEVRTGFLGLNPIDLCETPQDESNDSAVSVKPTIEGELTTTDGSTLNQGDGHAAENLDPDKNKK